MYNLHQHVSVQKSFKYLIILISTWCNASPLLLSLTTSHFRVNMQLHTHVSCQRQRPGSDPVAGWWCEQSAGLCSVFAVIHQLATYLPSDRTKDQSCRRFSQLQSMKSDCYCLLCHQSHCSLTYCWSHAPVIATLLTCRSSWKSFFPAIRKLKC